MRPDPTHNSIRSFDYDEKTEMHIQHDASLLERMFGVKSEWKQRA